MKRLLLVAVAAIGALAAGMATPLHAQGVTTGGLTGMVTDETGQPIEAAQVQLKNPATGRITGALTRASGLYLIQGIEPDANYTITVRRIGFEPQTRERHHDHAQPDAPRGFQAVAPSDGAEQDPGRRDDGPGDQRDEVGHGHGRVRFGAAPPADAEPQLLRFRAARAAGVDDDGLPVGRRREPSPERDPDRRRAGGRPLRPRHDGPAGQLGEREVDRSRRGEELSGAAVAVRRAPGQLRRSA